MKKTKRIGLLFRKLFLRPLKFVGTDVYNKFSYKYFSDCGVVFHGRPLYINYDVDFDLTAPNMIHVGEDTVIAKGTILLTHDFSIECGLKAIGKNTDIHKEFIKEIHIGSHCFIGARSFILPGSVIGDHCIIGAGSVVSGNIPDNCIYAGNPARFITHTDEWALKKYKENAFVDSITQKEEQKLD